MKAEEKYSISYSKREKKYSRENLKEKRRK